MLFILIPSSPFVHQVLPFTLISLPPPPPPPPVAVELVPLLQAEVRKLREMLAAQQHEQGLVLQQASRGGTLPLPPRHNGGEGSQGSVYGNGGGGGGLGQQGGVDEVEEMRERVRELEHQLAERERLIESLDILR